MNRGAKFLVLGLAMVTLIAAAPAAQAANLHYYGGPVAHSMNVVLVPWGNSARSSYTDSGSGDPAFFTYLAGQSGATSDIGGVLAQYMDTTGHNSQNRRFALLEHLQLAPNQTEPGPVVVPTAA